MSFNLFKHKRDKYDAPIVEVSVDTDDENDLSIGDINIKLNVVDSGTLRAMNHEKEQKKISSEALNNTSPANKVTSLYSDFMPSFEENRKLAIVKKLQTALDGGFDVSKTISSIENLIPEGYNADEIVRTEMVFLSYKNIYNFSINSGAIATEWQSLGPKRTYNRKTKSYDISTDECADNEKTGGRTLGKAYPSGHLFPPAHTGCTCGIRVMYAGDSDLKKVRV